MRNIKLIVAYDGHHYLGWQKTQEGISIEETLQNSLEKIFQEPLQLQAASRTDAGVHALGQVVNFLSNHSQIPLDRLKISLNSLLPEDIRILKVEQMPDPFHPTLDCKEKEYHYWICNDAVQLPHYRFYSWHIHTPLDIEAMKRGAKLLTGIHDFAAFCNTLHEKEYETTIREIRSLDLQIHPEQRLKIIVRGPNFLFRMVRNVVGTLVDIGRGKLAVEQLPSILTNKDRTQAGVTAPAHGLTLFQVFY